MYALSLLNKDLFLIRVCSLRAGVLGGWKWRPQGGGGGGQKRTVATRKPELAAVVLMGSEPWVPCKSCT